jgi:hypothetical protein
MSETHGDPIEPAGDIDAELNRLAEDVGRALRRLPAPAAPEGFALRVMQRVAATASGEPDDDRVVAPWPTFAKLGLATAGLVLVVGGFLLWPVALMWVRAAWPGAHSELWATVADLAPRVATGGLLYVSLMCLAVAGAASLLRDVALGGANR